MTTPSWEPIADDLSRRGWSWGIVRALLNGRLLWIADAHRDDGHRYVAQAESKAKAFEELRNAVGRAPLGRRDTAAGRTTG